MKLANINLIKVELDNLKTLGIGFESYSYKTVPIDLIFVSEEGIKNPHYYDLYKNGVELPPLAVVERDGRYEILDGNKRYKSALAAGRNVMDVLVLVGVRF